MPENSDVVRDALRTMSTSCTHISRVGDGICGLPLDVGLAKIPNLVCDQVLVGTCSAGHERMVSVID